VTSVRRAASPAAGRKPGSQRCGLVYVTLRPRSGPKHSIPRCAAVLVSWRQRGHLSWKASIVRSTAHGPARSAIASVSSSTVSSVSASAPPMAARTSSACSEGKRTPSGCVGTDDGRADSAPVHIGRSAVGSRWMVPRGPNVLTRVRCAQSARRTSARVALAMRRPIESSAALGTWACAPHSTPAMSAGPRSVAGSASAWRAIRRAVTPRQVRVAGVAGFTLMNGHSPWLPRQRAFWRQSLGSDWYQVGFPGALFVRGQGMGRATCQQADSGGVGRLTDGPSRRQGG
jgi:hypothetical protein